MSEEPERSWQLAVTRRCREEDLGLSASDHWRDQISRFPILQAFADRRGQVPEGSERVRELIPILQAPIFTLHSGQARGGTWYDPDEEIVWLIGVGWAHDYEHLVGLGRRGKLLPTDEDYAELEPSVPDVFELERIGRQVRELIADARAHPGEIVEGELAERVHVRICREVGEPAMLTVAISERIGPGTIRLPQTWKLMVAQAFFPGTAFPDDYVPFAQRVDDSGIRPDELALINFLPDVV